MKTRVLFVILALLLCVGSVGAVASVSESFQGWGSNVIGFGPSTTVQLYNASTGEINTAFVSGSGSYIMNINPMQYNYVAVDSISAGAYPGFTFLDSTKNSLLSCTDYTGEGISGRYEFSISSGLTLSAYKDGSPIPYCSGTLSAYPSYFEPYVSTYDSFDVDNIVIGSTDPHVVGALPSNWTIINDLLNPLSDGVYAWNNATQAWVLKNNLYFYIDADTSSQAGLGNENFNILYTSSGAIVNTTKINGATSPRNTIQYNISQFIASASPTTNVYGEYTAEFQGYPASASNFWLISQGAAINWSQATYPQNVNALITYQISSSYYQTSTYTYSINIVNTAGTTVQTYALNSATGTETPTLSSATYSPGVYYAELMATPIAGGTATMMAYAPMQVTAYVYLSGYINNAQTSLPLPSAVVNVSQLGVTASVTSGASGVYNVTQNWLTGSAISVVTNLAGYTTDTETFTPLASANVNLNISLLSTSPAYSNIAAGGILKDNQYGNPIPSATVYYQNTSYSQIYSNTTNNAGYYYTPGLTHTYLYNAWGEKSGYANTTIPVVAP